MPVERGTAAAQVRRLAQLPFYSTLTSEALTSMVDVVAANSETPSHAQRAISAWLQDSRGADARLPTEGDLMAILENTRSVDGGSSEVPDFRPQAKFCGRCNRGKVYREIKARGQVYTAMGTCVCQGGTAEPEVSQLALGASE